MSRAKTEVYNENEILLILLSSFKELPPRLVSNIAVRIEDCEEEFENRQDFLIKMLSDGVYNKIRKNLRSDKYCGKVLRELEDANIRCITYLSEDYPQELADMEFPPAVLYCKGNTALLKTRRLAVVGSRRTLPNMLKVCSNVVAQVSENMTVITGVADGGDTAVIEGALESGNVIVNLPYGFSDKYPSRNASIIEKVEKKGLVLTQFAPHTPPLSYSYVERNRVLAELAEGVFVVSAGIKSGTFSTVRFAQETCKKIFAFPYSIGITSGEGCNALIRNGAKLVVNAEDILEEFALGCAPKKRRSLDSEEEIVYCCLKDSGGDYVGSLSQKTKIPEFRLLPVLARLELDGFAVRMGGNRYSAL